MTAASCGGWPRRQWLLQAAVARLTAVTTVAAAAAVVTAGSDGDGWQQCWLQAAVACLLAQPACADPRSTPLTVWQGELPVGLCGDVQAAPACAHDDIAQRQACCFGFSCCWNPLGWLAVVCQGGGAVFALC